MTDHPLPHTSHYQTVRTKETSAKQSGDYGSDVRDTPSDHAPHAVKGEVALWRAVITQALMDAGSDSQKPEMRYERAQARSWLLGFSKDFSDICHMAMLHPDYVRRKARDAIESGCTWRLDQKWIRHRDAEETRIKRLSAKRPAKMVVIRMAPVLERATPSHGDGSDDAVIILHSVGEGKWTS